MKEHEIAEDQKKPETKPSQATQEGFFAHRPPDELQASQAIRRFIAQHLQRFHEQMQTAIDLFEHHVQNQNQEVRAILDQRGFLDFIGDRFEEELMILGGGNTHPFASALVRELHDAVCFAQHSDFTLSSFIHNAFRRGMRDACWYLRDASSAVLAAHWPRLSQLAAEGGHQFVPALYALGLPSPSFNPIDFADLLKRHTETYRHALLQQQDELQSAAQLDPQQQEIAQAAQKDLLEANTKPALSA